MHMYLCKLCVITEINFFSHLLLGQLFFVTSNDFLFLNKCNIQFVEKSWNILPDWYLSPWQMVIIIQSLKSQVGFK